MPKKELKKSVFKVYLLLIAKMSITMLAITLKINITFKYINILSPNNNMKRKIKIDRNSGLVN